MENASFCFIPGGCQCHRVWVPLSLTVLVMGFSGSYGISHLRILVLKGTVVSGRRVASLGGLREIHYDLYWSWCCLGIHTPGIRPRIILSPSILWSAVSQH